MRFVIIGVLVSSTLLGWFLSGQLISEQVDPQLVQFVRSHFKSQLKKMKKPNFESTLGYLPRRSEADLGRLLFNDPLLSRNNDVSCATCHLTNHGFATGNSLDFGALGKGQAHGNNIGAGWADGQISKFRGCGDDGEGFHCRRPMFRNALSTVNVVYRADWKKDSGLLWDGRFGNLAFQVLLPIHTSEEMCGTNPLSLSSNLFGKKGVLFKEPIRISHSHGSNRYSGEQFDSFNAPPELIDGIETFRGSGAITFPTRNECLAIAVAKVRSIPKYRELFQSIYKKPVSDLLIGRSIASFVSSHIADDTPYDRFLAGDDSALTTTQLRGLISFFSPLKEKVLVPSGISITGAGCTACHTAPLFGGGDGFFALGVKGDERSALSTPKLIFSSGQNGFISNLRGQRGDFPSCHLKGVTVSGRVSPDMGRAFASFNRADCFKFRAPPLRNVIETAPYFHHGTANGQGYPSENFRTQSEAALRQTISFHLMGKQNWKAVSSLNYAKEYFDPYFQLDQLIPFNYVDLPFHKIDRTGKENTQSILSENDFESLFQFVAYGLWDPSAVKKGYWGNDLSHPKAVPSGFLPTVTRDGGRQTELPPNSEFQ